ncbi:MAG: protein kinase [Bryobacterales bacterium]|nr:protein kinase [Bryobacterales bacterium]
MQPDRFAQLHRLFEQALPLSLADREMFLRAVAADHPDLAQDLVQLLATHDKGTDRISQVPGPQAPPRHTGNPSMIFGSYLALRELGRGGMGTVYLAVRNDDAFRKTVALKVIRSDDDDFVRRFKQERQILAALDHPHIARILDGGTTPDNRPYFVMEYVEGKQIDGYCDDTKAGLADRIRLFQQVLSAVQYLHDNNVIHRDLKPGNILVDRHGHAKLLDFGIAKIQGLAGLAGTSEMRGGPTLIMTPGYAAPEQLEGKAATKASDVYSLGIILYELITGKAPFVTADQTPNIAAQIAGVEPPLPSANLQNVEQRTSQTAQQYRKRLMGDLDRIVLMALRRDPARRYQTATQFSEDLSRFLNGQPPMTQQAAPGAAGRLSKPVMAGAALVVLLLAGGGAWLGLRAYGEGVRVQAQQNEIERLLGLLDSRQVAWSTPAASEPDKIADLQVARRILKQDLPGTSASARADLERCRKLLDRLMRYLAKADALTSGQPAVRRELVTAYQAAGELQSPAAQLIDKAGAVAAYQRAAVVAASLKDTDSAWVREQLASLEARLTQLGAKLEASVPSEPAPVPPAPSAEPPPADASPSPARPAQPSGGRANISPQPAPSEPAPTPVAPPPSTPAPKPAVTPTPTAPAVSSEEVAELQQRLDTALGRLRQIRRNVDDLRKRVEANGQTLRSDIPATLSRVETALTLAQSDLQRANTTAARESLQRAEYELRTLAREVGN